MSVTASLVQRLHRTNRQKTDLTGQLARGPKLVAVVARKQQSAQQHVADMRSRLTRLKIDADSKQLQMREREEKIHKWRNNLNAAKENREYQALKDQIAADEQANLVLADEILEILESIDEVTAGIAAGDAQVLLLEQELHSVQQQVADRKVVLESELARINTELAEAEQGLTWDFKREYSRLVIAKGEDAMAELEGNCCGGCYQSLTPQKLDQLLQGNPILCPACGRLIYQDSER